MKVNKIDTQSLPFKGGKQAERRISSCMRASIESLLLRMNKETTITKQGDSICSKITKKLINENGTEFIDNRNLTNTVPFSDQMQGVSIIKNGGVIIEINNATGEVINLQKPFFKTWKNIQKKSELLLNDFRANFYNTKTVKKETVDFIV